MIRILIIILLITSNYTIGQDSISPEKDDLIKNLGSNTIDKINKKFVIISDTTELNLNSSDELIIPTNSNNKTKVVIVKEKNSFDFLKYLLPILTLLLGIGINKFLDKQLNKKKINKSGERWIAELRSLKEPLIKQVQSLQEFLKEHEKEEFKIPRLEIYSSLNGDIFKSLDKNELIQFIENNNKKLKFTEIVKISNKIHGYTSILIHLSETLKEKFNKFLSGVSLHTTSLSKNLQSFLRAFADFGVYIERQTENPMLDARYKPIAELYKEHITPYLNEGDYNVFVLDKDFFMPIIDILSHQRFDESIKPLTRATTSCLDDIKGIRFEKKYMTDNVKTILEHYNEQIENLDKIINKIEKH